MELVTLGSLVLNLVISIYCYGRLYKKRILYSDRFGMTISMASSMVTTLFLTMNLSFLLPINVSHSMIICVLVGILIGIAFGALVRLQSILAGSFGGTMGGMIGAMTGAVLKNPALCNLPQFADIQIQKNMMIFSGFSLVMIAFSVWLILYSLEV